MNKDVNPIAKDQTMWLANVRRPCLVLTTTYQDNMTIREVGSLEAKSIPNCQRNHVVVFKLKFLGFMRIHHVFHVSLLEPDHVFTIPRRVHDPLPFIEVDGKHEFEMEDVLDSKIYNH